MKQKGFLVQIHQKQCLLDVRKGNLVMFKHFSFISYELS
jgi:hypothetical protein